MVMGTQENQTDMVTGLGHGHYAWLQWPPSIRQQLQNNSCFGASY